MGCCGRESSPEANDNEKFKKHGMIQNRKCRDMLCCLMFAAFWVGMIVIGAIGLKYGQPERLTHGTDYLGRLCGVDDGVKNVPYVAYPNPNMDYLMNLGVVNPLMFKFYGICVEACPSAYQVVCNYNTNTTGLSQSALQTCMLAAYNSTITKPAGCTSKIQNNCYVVASNTDSPPFMMHCVPIYDVQQTSKSDCLFPAGIDPNDPACVTIRTFTNGTIVQPARTNKLFDQMNTARQIWGRWFGDLQRAWWVVLLCAVGFAVVLGFIWLFFAQYCTKLYVWGTIIMVLIGTAALDAYLYHKAGILQIDLPDAVQNEISNLRSSITGISKTASNAFTQELTTPAVSANAYKVLAIAMTVVLFILVAMIVALRKSISTGVEIIKLGAEAMRNLKSALLLPITTSAAILLFLVWWIFVAANLATAGSIAASDLQGDLSSGLQQLRTSVNANGNVPGLDVFNTTVSLALNSTLMTFEANNVTPYLLIYHVFGLFWTVQFIQGISMMTIAGAVCAWYFNQNESNDPEVEKIRYPIGRFPLWKSMGRTLRYYLGTVAFGSLLIAFIQMIRAILFYVQRRLKERAKGNAQAQFALCCVNCCLKCIQTCVEMITRNAYIFTALKGTSFCGSGKSVFKLILNNAGVLGMINSIGELLIFLGRVIVAALCGWIAYAFLDNVKEFQINGAKQINSTWLVILVTVFFAYIIAGAFMNVFDLSVDTVCVCYLTDMEENMIRHGGDSRHKIPAHVKADKLDIKARAKRAKNEAAVKPASGSMMQMVAPNGGVAMPSTNPVIAAPSAPAPGTGAAPKIV